MEKPVLIMFEESGKVRDAFIERGYPAMSCDLLPGRGKYTDAHLRGDIWHLLKLDGFTRRFSGAIMHPPCTYICVSGNRHYANSEKRVQALRDVWKLLRLPFPFIALENPKGVISSQIRKPDQYIQPFQFGHPESKLTGLWLWNLPKLEPTKDMQLPREGHWANQTPSGQNKLGPSEHRQRLRSETYQGIADAMADQWGPVIFGR